MVKRTIAVIALVVFAFSVSPAAAGEGYDNEVSAGSVAADVLLVRPLGIAATALGTGIFIVGSPFIVLSGSTSVAAKKLIGEPFAFTFLRDVGEINGY